MGKADIAIDDNSISPIDAVPLEVVLLIRTFATAFSTVRSRSILSNVFKRHRTHRTERSTDFVLLVLWRSFAVYDHVTVGGMVFERCGR